MSLALSLISKLPDIVSNNIIEADRLKQPVLIMLNGTGCLAYLCMVLTMPVPVDRIDGVPVYRCYRCGYRWFPRNLNPDNLDDIGELPVTCANRRCQSPYWNREYKNKKKSAKKNRSTSSA